MEKQQKATGSYRKCFYHSSTFIISFINSIAFASNILVKASTSSKSGFSTSAASTIENPLSIQTVVKRTDPSLRSE